VLSDREQKSGTFGASLSDYFVAVGLDAEQSLSAQTAMMIGRLEVVGAGDAPVDMTKASVSTTGGVTIVNREDVAGYLAAAKAELEQ
jgi:pyrroline-5-carboxylate reductase